MALRIEIDNWALERVAFAYSPLLETLLALRVLVEPKRHPLQHPWVRRMRRLPPSLRQRIGAFSFLYRFTIPDFALPGHQGGFPALGDELQRLAAADPEQLALDFVRPLWDHAGERDPARLRVPGVRDTIAERAAQLSADAAVALLALDEPLRLVEEFTAFVRDFWAAGFGEEWEALEPKLADAVAEGGRVLAAGGVFALIDRLSPRLRVERERERFGLDIPHRHLVRATEERPLVLVPSAFVWPDVTVNCDEPWPLALVYPAPFVVAEARPALPPEDLLRVLRSLADHTRLRALRLIADRPRTTQELAPLIGMTEAGLSKHLRQLADAGLVRGRREGYYVLYELAPERLDVLSEAVRSFIEAEEPSA